MDTLVARHQALGQALLEHGIISEDQLRIALQEQSTSSAPLGHLLVSLGFVSEAVLRDALGTALGKKSVSLSSALVDASAVQLVPQEVARRHRLIPLAYDGHRLTVAMADVHDIVALDHLRALVPDDVALEPVIAGEQEIARAIDQYYGHELSIDGILHEIETGEIDYRSLTTAGSDEYSQPVVRLIDALLTDAVKRDASDIHFEPEQNFLRIRYRIDGMLRQIRVLHKTYWPAMAVRVKVMSGMNIAESRAPQDGRISLNVSGRSVDFRVSVQPTVHGENLVLRILDRQKGLVPLTELGLRDQHVAQLHLMMERPEGIILVTGPTGSGKTTTLYAVLSQINNEAINIMTLEDPVEYPIAMIRQTSISETSKLDFVDGIRSMMRQDPDVILVGEIRDKDTAVMTFRAAMTGHQVYSTLHTNSALGAIPRLLDIGIPAETMAGNIIGVIAQRLVRRLCPHCKRPVPAQPHEMRLFGLDEDIPPPTIYQATGCRECEFQGYRGRMAIMELLRLDPDLDELIARRATLRDMRALASSKGFITLAQDAVSRVLDGHTSMAEVARVVDLTHGTALY
ncbi:MAG: ATPase, T2SS/T4P/T4SS family [Rhodocyclaceae bacterium]|nr:ATPase, T2SS/T4P/T4SS family [Rhodocyclaceae bacterium]